MYLHIKQPGQTVTYKGRNYKTPIKLKVRDIQEATRIEKKLTIKSIVDYEIIDDDLPTNSIRTVKLKNSYKLNDIGKKDTNHIIESMEESVSKDIVLDCDSENILKQLLANV